MATKTAKKTAKKSDATKASTRKEAKDALPRSMPKGGKDPQGGLTAEGRAFFARTEGAHLRPGVKGPADTPDKMVRKGSFLRRHFTHPRGPMQDAKGEPTRLALSAHAWGEPVPRTAADARKLARKGHELLEQYHEMEGSASGKSPAKRGAKTASEKKAAPKKTKDATSAAKKAGTASKSANASPAKRVARTGIAGKKAPVKRAKKTA